MSWHQRTKSDPQWRESIYLWPWMQKIWTSWAAFMKQTDMEMISEQLAVWCKLMLQEWLLPDCQARKAHLHTAAVSKINFFFLIFKNWTALCRLNYEWNIDIFLVYFFSSSGKKKVHLPPHHPRDFLAGLYLQFLQIFYKLFPSAQPGLRTPPTTDLCFTLPTFSCCCMCL